MRQDRRPHAVGRLAGRSASAAFEQRDLRGVPVGGQKLLCQLREPALFRAGQRQQATEAAAAEGIDLEFERVRTGARFTGPLLPAPEALALVACRALGDFELFAAVQESGFGRGHGRGVWHGAPVYKPCGGYPGEP